MRRRRAAVLAVLVLGVAACGNSGDDEEATPTSAGGGEAATTTAAPDGGGGGGSRDEFVAIEGVPGVSDEEIRYTLIGTGPGNPLGTCMLECFADGVEAYFAFRNDEGGVYGRDLVLHQAIDDELANNQVRSLEVASGDEAFGVFQATLLASGWGDLDAAGIPTYVWNIHGTEFAGRQSLFGNAAALCIGCTGRAVPYAAMASGATRAAALGYGISENSKVCAQSQQASIERYAADTGVEFAYLNDELDFGLPNGLAPEVTAMKEAGVDFITACFDLNAMKSLAEELQRQGMDDVTLYHPNTYNQAFVAEAGDLFEGDVVSVGFRPFESEAVGGLADFLEWMDATGADLTELAMVGWINADLAFQGLLGAGPEFDRQAVIDATNQLTEYTAGGLLVPIDWSRQHDPVTEDDRETNGGPLECFAGLRVVDGAFEPMSSAAEPWLCWDNYDRAWSEPTPTNFE